MHLQTIIFTLALSLFSLVAVAGSGHDHGNSHDPASQLQAEEGEIKSVPNVVQTRNHEQR